MQVLWRVKYQVYRIRSNGHTDVPAAIDCSCTCGQLMTLLWALASVYVVSLSVNENLTRNRCVLYEESSHILSAIVLSTLK